jgi:hypothetical protein
MRFISLGLVCLVAATASAAEPPWELEYAGSFRLPVVRNDKSRFGFGARSLTLHPNGKSLWVQGHEHHQMIAEVRIPETLVRSHDPKELPIAEVVTPFVDVTGGRRRGQRAQLGGVAIDPELQRFWWTVEQGYDVAPQVYATVGYTSLDFKESHGPWMCDVGNKLTERYITLAPREFAAQHFGGRYLICGQAGVAGTAGSIQVPCAVAVEPPRGPESQAISTVKLLFYPEENKFRDDRGAWGRADIVWSAAWIDFEDRHWIAFSALVGTGVPWYGPGDRPPEGGIVDQWRNAKGYHAPPYEERLYIYAADDLVRVARGEIPSWRPVPVKVLDLRPALLKPGHAVVALAYDADRRRLYLSEDKGDRVQSKYESTPVVHAYDLAGGRPAAAVARQTGRPSDDDAARQAGSLSHDDNGAN